MVRAIYLPRLDNPRPVGSRDEEWKISWVWSERDLALTWIGCGVERVAPWFEGVRKLVLFVLFVGSA